MTENIYRSPKKRGKIAIFLSGRGSNFMAIHDAILSGKINAEIGVVFSNKKDAQGKEVKPRRLYVESYLNQYPNSV